MGFVRAFRHELAEVENGDDVRMRSEPAHGLGLEGDSLARDGVEGFDLDDGNGNVAVEKGVPRLVHPLPRAFAYHFPEGVASVDYHFGDGR